MTKRNPEYDFKWCPGCGDFGVRRALEIAITDYTTQHEIPHYQNVIVAGIGCSGNMVHLMEKDQPFGFHGVHGRTLPVAFGIKMSRPDINTVVVAGDGDFLSIGAEHIGPMAQRNLDVACVVMDNGVYGLTKGQGSPTSTLGQRTTSTPHGKIEIPMHPLRTYMTAGVTFIASHYSIKPRALAQLILAGMNHKGFAIIHVQSPCTTYNDTYDLLKGSPKDGIQGVAWEIEPTHDPTSRQSAEELLQRPGVPLGLVYKAHEPTLEDRQEEIRTRVQTHTPSEILATYYS